MPALGAAALENLAAGPRAVALAEAMGAVAADLLGLVRTLHDTPRGLPLQARAFWRGRGAGSKAWDQPHGAWWCQGQSARRVACTMISGRSIQVAEIMATDHPEGSLWASEIPNGIARFAGSPGPEALWTVDHGEP